jgi:hypothetical protein
LSCLLMPLFSPHSMKAFRPQEPEGASPQMELRSPIVLGRGLGLQ